MPTFDPSLLGNFANQPQVQSLLQMLGFRDPNAGGGPRLRSSDAQAGSGSGGGGVQSPQGGSDDGYWAAPGRAGGVTGQSLLNYVTNTFGGSKPASYTGNSFTGLEPNEHNFTYPMTGDAQQVMSQQKFPVDPSQIYYGGGKFTVGNNAQGPDLFGGKFDPQTMPLSQMPRELQPLLAPALVRYYKDNDFQTGAARGQESAPWTGFFAPPAPAVGSGQFEHTWPGITHYDPWGRSLGEYAALYS